jgi:D-sedoheptulose 7-phosphate isomerase
MLYTLNDEELIRQIIMESIKVKQQVSEQLVATISKISYVISDALKQNGTIYLFGNGGSAADAQHIAAEFVGRFARERQPLPAESFTTNTSILTSIGNDYDFSEIFSRQVKARVTKKDVVIGISTSGKSPNILKALKEAKLLGCKSIGFTGINPSEMKDVVDICLCVPSNSTPRIQESHILIWHIICELVEKSIVKDK